MSQKRLFTLCVEDHLLHVPIGLYAREKGTEQRLFLTVKADILVDISPLLAGKPLDIDQSHDYASFIDMAHEIVESHEHIDMVEEFAEKLAIKLFKAAAFEKVFIKLVKPDIVDGSTNVGCEITRYKEDMA